MKFTSHSTNHFKVCDPVAFSALLTSCNHHLSLVSKLLHRPKRTSPDLFSLDPAFLLPPSPGSLKSIFRLCGFAYSERVLHSQELLLFQSAWPQRTWRKRAWIWRERVPGTIQYLPVGASSFLPLNYNHLQSTTGCQPARREEWCPFRVPGKAQVELNKMILVGIWPHSKAN